MMIGRPQTGSVNPSHYRISEQLISLDEPQIDKHSLQMVGRRESDPESARLSCCVIFQVALTSANEERRQNRWKFSKSMVEDSYETLAAIKIKAETLYFFTYDFINRS